MTRNARRTEPGTGQLEPLASEVALACRGGGDGDNPIQQLVDWVTGGNPTPGQWPPMML